MQDTLCLSSITESKELSLAGGPQDFTSANNNNNNISSNVSACGDDGDDSPVIMQAKHHFNREAAAINPYYTNIFNQNKTPEFE